MLPRAVCWHYLHHQHEAEDSLLLLQSDCSLCFNFFHGSPWLHSSSRRGRKADSGWVKGKSSRQSVSQNVRRNVKWCSLIMLDNAARDERHENGGFRLPPSARTIPNNPAFLLSKEHYYSTATNIDMIIAQINQIENRAKNRSHGALI